jgi:hypothetical protein
LFLHPCHTPVTRPSYNADNHSKGDDKMKKINNLFKKFALVFLVLVVVMAAFPLAEASAAGLNEEPAPTANGPVNFRLEQAWHRQQRVYERQERQLDEADGFIQRVQNLIERAEEKGWDTTVVQTALDAFTAAIPASQAAHDKGAAIVANHAGFDANGHVVDRTQAVETVKSLAQVLKDSRTAMDGTARALHEALRKFRQAHPPVQNPTP